MKANVLTFLAVLTAVSALPNEYLSFEARQVGAITSNELKNGPCKSVTFIMARGSTEQGNMGQIPGPPTCAMLKQQLGGDVACQGIGTEDGYPATLQANLLPKNTQDSAIQGCLNIVNLAATKCPTSRIVLGGYSQGSAVVDNAIQAMPAGMKAKIMGVVLFGYTRNAQDKAQIPGYPKAQTKIFCAPGDLVCDNTLVITLAHLTYAQNAPEAAKFLASMVQGGGSGGAAAGIAIEADAGGVGGVNDNKASAA